MTEDQLQHEMQTFQGRCDLKMSHLADSIGELKSALFGNGREGVTTRMMKMEIAVGELVEQRREMRRLVRGAVASIIIAMVLTLISQAFSYARQQEVLTQTVQGMREIKQEIAVKNE